MGRNDLAMSGDERPEERPKERCSLGAGQVARGRLRGSEEESSGPRDAAADGEPAATRRQNERIMSAASGPLPPEVAHWRPRHRSLRERDCGPADPKG